MARTFRINSSFGAPGFPRSFPVWIPSEHVPSGDIVAIVRDRLGLQSDVRLFFTLEDTPGPDSASVPLTGWLPDRTVLYAHRVKEPNAHSGDLDVGETRAIKSFFQNMDRDGHGTISIDSMKSVFTGTSLSEEDLAKVFAMAGSDLSGFSYNEFVDWIAGRAPPPKPKLNRAKSPTSKLLKKAMTVVQATQRLRRITQSTEGYVRGVLRDDTPVPGTEVKPSLPQPKLPIDDFGKFRFKGATAAPYLIARGLNADVLETSEWTELYAEEVAFAVMDWAGSLGALFVCHWTQPFRSATSTWRVSEPTRMVHALFNPDGFGKPTTILCGEYLLYGEGDSRKMIDTTSPMWVRGDTLFIPCVFGQYNNSWQDDAVIDEKTPLLRSMDALSKAGVRLLRLLGHECTDVVPKIGLEQEFYMVPRAGYDRRPDLRLCGRTLVGVEADGGDLYDTHSGPMNAVAQSAMATIQAECFKLGIALRTRHREGGPNQYEYAPHFGLVTAQIDENLIVMEIIEDVARQHGLVALFHEKPFTGISGSGKHNNFSLSTETHLNLFSEKHVNAIDKNGQAGGSYDVFPTLIAAVCRAVYLHGDLILNSVATPGNDFRLTKGGAAEAPPLTISIYAGESLTEHLERFARTESLMEPFVVQKEKLQLGIASVDALGGIEVSKEPRNRTAPFPYGGRRFELRAVGSSQNVSMANVVLCSAIAESFNFFSKQMEAGSTARQVAGASLREHGLAAIFNGNNYKPEWKAEADKRGIYSADSIVDAMSRLETKKAAELFGGLGVFSSEELETRASLYYENYAITIKIEAKCLIDMLTTRLLPLALAGKGTVDLGQKLEAKVPALQAALDAIMEAEVATLEQAKLCTELRLGLMVETRTLVNALEKLTPSSQWPMATYKELLFDDMAHCSALPFK